MRASPLATQRQVRRRVPGLGGDRHPQQLLLLRPVVVHLPEEHREVVVGERVPRAQLQHQAQVPFLKLLVGLRRAREYGEVEVRLHVLRVQS